MFGCFKEAWYSWSQGNWIISTLLFQEWKNKTKKSQSNIALLLLLNPLYGSAHLLALCLILSFQVRKENSVECNRSPEMDLRVYQAEGTKGNWREQEGVRKGEVVDKRAGSGTLGKGRLLTINFTLWLHPFLCHLDRHLVQQPHRERGWSPTTLVISVGLKRT